jgi:hypothetical protein
MRKPIVDSRRFIVRTAVVLFLTGWMALSNSLLQSDSAGRPIPSIKLSGSQELNSDYTGSSSLRSALQQNLAKPLSLAAADFDEDGVPDLICGYTNTGRGAIALHRGNRDALSQNGINNSPFLPTARVFDLAGAPDFIAAGDFNSDGHWDIAAAARGSDTLYLLPGDGRGGFGEPQPADLPGRVTAMAAGEINRADGLVDLAVGIAGSRGPQALLFESPNGALNASPEAFDLPAEPASMSIGRIDGDQSGDLAVAAGDQLVVVEGRDRKLSLDDARRAEVKPAAVAVRAFQSTITAVAIGDFANRYRLAVLFDDGAVQLIGTASIDGAESSLSNYGRWQAREVLRTSRSSNTSPSSLLLAARISNHSGQDLIVADSDRLRFVAGGVEAVATFRESDVPVAALPMQLNGDARSDLVMLRSSRSSPSVTLTAPEATFTVTTAADSGPGSLRDAITQANSTPGADAINFSIGSGLQTINLLSPLPAIIETVAINGATQPGFTGAPLIVLNGSGAGSAARGLQILAANCVIRSLVVNGFSKTGIYISGGGATGNQVQGCYVGTNAAGTAAVPNGTSQTGFDIDGIDIVNGAQSNTIGGTTAGSRNVISGNSGGFSDGVLIAFPGSNNNIIQGNYLGLNAAGTAAIPNGFTGVEIATIGGPGPQGNLVGGTTAGAGNVASGNLTAGVGIFNENSNNNLVQGNFLGTNASGTAAVPNGLHGVAIANPPGGPLSAKNNLVGGTTPAARNIISGNSFDGVFIAHSDTDNNLVQGNFIGTDVTGASALPNVGRGVEIAFGARANTVGGTASGARNLLSGNNNDGAAIFNPGTSGNQVQGNFIGTDLTGAFAIPNGAVNGFHGVEVAFGATGNTVGGTATGAGNLISGNIGVGVGIFNPGTSGNIVQGNLIGTDASGTAALVPRTRTTSPSDRTPGNGQLRSKFGGQAVITNPATNSSPAIAAKAPEGAIANSFGVIAIFGSQGTIIGGAAQGAGNTIAFNSRSGVLIDSDTGHNTRGNSIFSNGGLGIDLGNGLGFFGDDGITPNDSCDGDSGANNLQNFPVLTTTTSFPGSTTIEGTLNSAASTTFTLDFFSNTECDASGNGEGKTYIGSATVTTAGNCIGSFNVTIPSSVPAGQFVTATATDPSGNTSEFSACRLVVQGCSYSISPTGQTFTAAGGMGSVSVTAPPGCNWMAASNDGFISITSGSSGSGNGVVDFTVAANGSAAPRIGTMTIAGQTFTVTQSGVTCAGIISPASAAYSAAGGMGSVMIPAPSGCAWTATSLDAWITITSGNSGTGPGTVDYSVAANPGPPRTGTLIVASQVFTVTQSSGLQYYPLPFPVRLLDTRPGEMGCFNNSGLPLGNDAVLTQPATGTCLGATIPSTAKAIVGNATVVNFISTGFNWITLFPSDAPQPNASNLNFTANQIVPNNFTVGLGPDGAFKIYSRASTHFIVDVTGYYAPPGSGGLFYHPLPAPIRLFDSRPGETACDAPAAPLANDGTRTVTAHGACLGATIPSSAKAIVGNATVVNFISSGFNWITLYPFGTAQPNASNLNFTASDIVPNAFTVGLSSDGKFNIYSRASTHFIVDVTGYFSDEVSDVNGQGLLYNPLPAPVRLLDTRPGEAGCDAPGAPLGNDATRTQTAHRTCFGITVPSTAKAVVGNATVVNFISTGFHWITLYPFGAAQPNASNLNFHENHIVPNAFVTGLSSDGKFNIYSHAATHFIVDLTGYFAP